MATANCVHPHAQLEHAWAHCEQWHEHHNAHWREHCEVLSTPRTVCRCTCVHTSHLWLKSRPVCHSISSMHARLCLVAWVFSPHPSLYFFIQFLFQLYLMAIPASDEISMEDPLCDSSLGSMVTLDYVTPLTHHATEEELNVYRSNWWIRSNFVGSDTMPVRDRADFKEALSTLRRLKNQEDQAYYQNWWQSSSSSWWQWQDSWWHPSSETSPRRWTQHWWSGETCENSDWAYYSWNDSQHWFDAELQWKFGNSQQQFVTDGECKEFSSKYRNNGYGNSTTKTTTTTWAMRQSVRPTTAWTTSETTRATCTSPEHERRARTFVHLFILSHTSFGSRSESCHFISIVNHERTSLSRFSILLPLVLPCLLLFLPPPVFRAVLWARQPDRHGKPVLLRQGEWRRLRRLRLPHTLHPFCVVSHSCRNAVRRIYVEHECTCLFEPIKG